MNTLQPLGPAVYGEALENLVQQYLVSISGVEPSLVRPRWQPDPPRAPGFDVDWLAVGVENIARSWQPYQWIRTLVRRETITVALTAYGPNSMGLVALIQDNIQQSLNHGVLSENGLKYIRSTDIVAAPELVNSKWLRRHDINVILGRAVTREYDVLTIASANVILNSDMPSSQSIEVRNDQ